MYPTTDTIHCDYVLHGMPTLIPSPYPHPRNSTHSILLPTYFNIVSTFCTKNKFEMLLSMILFDFSILKQRTKGNVHKYMQYVNN